MGNREQRDRWRQEAEPGPQAEEFFINGPNFFWNDPRPQGNIAALNLPQEVAKASVRRSVAASASLPGLPRVGSMSGPP